MKTVGLADGGNFALPINQTELGETLGITPVHTNRVLQDLRDRNLIQFQSKTIAIPDVQRLRAMCDFNPNYLHLEGGKKDAPREG